MKDVEAIVGTASVPANSAAAIRATVHDLLDELVGREHADRVISAIFCSGAELWAAFPAAAGREWGLSNASVVGVQAGGGDPHGLQLLIHARVAPRPQGGY